MQHRRHAQTREQMRTCSERVAQGLEQSVVAEPAVGDHQHRAWRKTPASAATSHTACVNLVSKVTARLRTRTQRNDKVAWHS
jgi:hypothetical protein